MHETTAVLGCGVIGTSWAEAFLSAGHRVRVWDPAADLGERLKPLADRYPGRLWVASGPEEAVEGAGFIQESGPETLEAKRSLLKRVEANVSPSAILASSTSTLMPTAIQSGLDLADRILIGHPFNPPHILPLVEVVGGMSTSEASIIRAMAFYRALGKHPIRLRLERPGHLANRLQAALWREAVDAVASGQADVADVDMAVTMALGPRWALMGPFTTFHLGGGPDGLAHFLDHLGRPFEELWDDARRPVMTPELRQRLIEGVRQSTGERRPEDMVAERDRLLRRILEISGGRDEAGLRRPDGPDDPARPL